MQLLVGETLQLHPHCSPSRVDASVFLQLRLGGKLVETLLMAADCSFVWCPVSSESKNWMSEGSTHFTKILYTQGILIFRKGFA
jgi:hypothetical protein